MWRYLALGLLLFGVVSQSDDEDAARLWADQYNQEAQVVYYEYMEAEWTYNTNITDHNSQKAVSSNIYKEYHHTHIN